MANIKEDDRVSWRSTRDNAKGSRYRIGTVLKVYGEAKLPYALVKPAKGHGHYQYLSLARLTKIETKEPQP